MWTCYIYIISNGIFLFLDSACIIFNIVAAPFPLLFKLTVFWLAFPWNQDDHIRTLSVIVCEPRVGKNKGNQTFREVEAFGSQGLLVHRLVWVTDTLTTLNTIITSNYMLQQLCHEMVLKIQLSALFFCDINHRVKTPWLISDSGVTGKQCFGGERVYEHPLLYRFMTEIRKCLHNRFLWICCSLGWSVEDKALLASSVFNHYAPLLRNDLHAHV